MVILRQASYFQRKFRNNRHKAISSASRGKFVRRNEAIARARARTRRRVIVTGELELMKTGLETATVE